MLLKAKHTVKTGDECYKPGDIFTINDTAQAKRIIELGAAIPIRKKVTLNFSSNSATDDLAKDLMDERRKDDSDKHIVDGGVNRVTAMSEASVPENVGNQHEVGDGFLSSLNDRVQAESGNVVNHAENQPVFTPKSGMPVSKNDVKQFAQAQVEKEGGPLSGREDLVNH